MMEGGGHPARLGELKKTVCYIKSTEMVPSQNSALQAPASPRRGVNVCTTPLWGLLDMPAYHHNTHMATTGVPGAVAHTCRT